MQEILVAIKLQDNKYFEETLLECENLCAAADIEIIKTLTQSSNSFDPNYGLRKGKLDELKDLVNREEIELVVFYNNLNTKIISNIKDYLEVEVKDRTAIILDIFALRAKSKEAKIQTEIARLKYNLPQLLKNDMDEGESPTN